jgi:hypothetical protein
MAATVRSDVPRQRFHRTVLAMVVDAKDDAGVAFYRHHGLESFGGKDRQLIVSLEHFCVRAGAADGAAPG